MKAIIIFLASMALMVSLAQAKTYDKPYGKQYEKPYFFDQQGCVRHLKAIAKAVKEAGGEVEKSDTSDRSYRMTLEGKTTIYTCTRHGLLETEL